jgi:DNA-binding beta-propeller fold protein YncE
VTLLSGCRTDDIIIYAEDEEIDVKPVVSETIGMYVLNEGNMGSNKCTLDYLDLSDTIIHYQRNIYAERNPGEVKELGDVGNDIQIYGSRLWLVINCSNKVEVCRASDAVKIGKINIPNCRYVTFDGGYAYVSSYVGPVAVGSNAPRGMVYKVDTLTLQKVDSVVVGYQPEEMAVYRGKLYVANSGGYNVPDYDNTVSVVDLASMRVERQIEVAVNLHRLRLDRHGQLWVTSRGDYNNQLSNLYWLAPDDKGQMVVRDRMNVQVSDLCIVGDSLYFYGVGYNEVTKENTRSYGIVDVSCHQVVSTSLSDSQELQKMRMPYGIIVHPVNRDFYLMDAKNYVSSGELLHFHADGTFDYKVRTGDIPGHAAFLLKVKR